MSGDTEKIIEISLAKIENSKARKVNGKAGVLHRNLLVNSLLNRVSKSSDIPNKTEPLMNYRESKLIVDLDMDEYDMDKLPTFKDRNIYQQRHTKQNTTKKQSSLVTKLNTRCIGKQDTSLQKSILSCDDLCEMKENKCMDVVVSCDCSKLSQSCPSCFQTLCSKQNKKRLHSVETSEEDCPRKRLRCLWTPNLNTKSQDMGFSVTSLSSLFGNLVANTEPEKSLDLRSKFVSAMVAC